VQKEVAVHKPVGEVRIGIAQQRVCIEQDHALAVGGPAYDFVDVAARPRARVARLGLGPGNLADVRDVNEVIRRPPTASA